MNITDSLALHAQNQPGKSALESGSETINFGELYALVENCKVRLHNAGISEGDTVTLILPSTAQHAVVILSLAAMGASIVTLPVHSTTPNTLERYSDGLTINHVISMPGAPRFGSVAQIKFDAVVGGLSRDEIPATAVPNSNDPNRNLLLGQSSGTTGIPKRFFLTHQQMLMRVEEGVSELSYSPSYRYLLGVALSFFNGAMQVLQRANMGATLVFPEFDSLQQYVDLIRRKNIDFTFVLPQRLQQLLELPSVNQGPLLDDTILLSGSSWLPPRLKQELREKISSRLSEFYGTNEAGVVAVDLPGMVSPHADATGKLIDTVEAEIVDENHERVPAGEIGNLRVRKAAPYICQHYIDNPEATARSFRDGWFYPGDIAAITRDRYLFLKGRSDDVINQGGMKMYPVEIESILLTHPAVAEVAVTSAPDRSFGQIAVAFVCLRSEETAQTLQDFCADYLGDRIPRAIVRLDEMPRNSAGKILKRVLRDSYLKQASAGR